MWKILSISNTQKPLTFGIFIDQSFTLCEPKLTNVYRFMVNLRRCETYFGGLNFQNESHKLRARRAKITRAENNPKCDGWRWDNSASNLFYTCLENCLNVIRYFRCSVLYIALLCSALCSTLGWNLQVRVWKSHKSAWQNIFMIILTSSRNMSPEHVQT